MDQLALLIEDSINFDPVEELIRLDELGLLDIEGECNEQAEDTH